jgi:integrase
MTAKQVAPGIYRDDKGKLWERPRIAQRRTWRRLYALSLKDAKLELAAKRSDQHRSKLGLAKNPYTVSLSVVEVLKEYAQAGFPDSHGRARNQRTALDEQRRLPRLLEWFKTKRVDELTFATAQAYGHTRGSTRAAELDLYTLRNALKHAALAGRIKQEPVSHWPKFTRKSGTRHCRDNAPGSGTELHRIAEELLSKQDTEPLAWLLLLLALTGCRVSEILALRMDASERNQPGFIQEDWLWLNRAKGGVNPFAVLHPPLRDCIAAHKQWHLERFPNHPAWIPHRFSNKEPASSCSLNHALKRITAKLNLPHRHTHALRAFFVTVRRSQGVSDAQIAAEIGDVTGASIIAQVYGAIPPNWRGGPGVSFLPETGFPAWHQWLPQSRQQSQVVLPNVESQSTSQKVDSI